MKARHKQKKVKQKKGWDFNRDGVSQGFIHSFINCKLQTHLRYKELWTSKDDPIFREFGSCFHWLIPWALNSQFKKPPGHTAISHAINYYYELWQEQHPKIASKKAQQMDYVFGLCEKVLPAYLKRWNGDYPREKKYKMGCNVVQVKKWMSFEETWKEPYEFKTGDDRILSIVFLKGKFDGVFIDKKNDLWLLETKCLSVIKEDEIMELLPLDIQCMLYLLAIYLKYGKKPKGVLYNIVRRPGLRQGKSETFKQLLDRVEKDVNHPKRQNHYFKRIEMVIDWSEIETWQKTFLNPVLGEIQDWSKGIIRTYMNPDALTSKYGRCELYHLIVHDAKNNFFRRKTVYNELTDNI